MSKLKIYYFNSTHWDREWYLPFQEFRYNLVKTIDDMISKLEKDDDYKVFTLDGQTIVLEDYKAIAKSRTEKLKKFIEDGRVLVGPWYVMPDELLVSGESLIRNLMFGEKIAEKWNVETFKYGYANDVFGHIAQMPQIFAGFNIKGTYLGRGLGDKPTITHFVWKSPDGTEIIAYRGFYGGFSLNVASHFKEEEFVEKLKNYIDEEISKCDIPIILIVDSNDHALANADCTEILKIIEAEYPEADVEFVSLEKMVEEQEKYKAKMPVVCRELCEPQHSSLDNKFTGQLVTVANSISSYYPLKLNNDKYQNLLEHIIEPMCVLALVEDKPLDRTYVDLAYDYLLKNQPHDSICGCSVDRTHKDMIYRYDQIESICNALKYDYLGNDYVGEHKTYILRLYNFDIQPQNRVVNVEIPFRLGFKKDANRFTKNEPLNAFVIKNKNGEDIPYQINGIIHNKLVRTKGQNSIYADLYNISFVAPIDSFGYSDFAIVEADYRPVYDDACSYTDHSAENQYIKMDIDVNGEISIFDKRTNQTYSGLNRFVDNADFGDGWFSMSPANDKAITSYTSSAQISRLKSGPAGVSFEIVKKISLPKEFDEKTFERSEEIVDLTIKSVVTLYKDSQYLDVKTEIENVVKDHRIQMIIPTGIYSKQYYASQAFAKITRKTGVELDGRRYFETEQLEKNMSGIVGIDNADMGFAFVSAEGLHETGVEENGNIHVTMLRSFKKVFLQPDAKGSQIQGKQVYRYAFHPTTKETKYSDLLHVQRSLEDNHLYSLKNSEITDLLEASFVKSTNKDIILSVLKVSENNEGIVLRVYNASDSHQETNIKIGFELKEIWSLQLNEEKKELIANTNEFNISIKPWEISTLLIK